MHSIGPSSRRSSLSWDSLRGGLVVGRMEGVGREISFELGDALAQDALEVGEVCRFRRGIAFHLAEHVAQGLKQGTTGLECHVFLGPVGSAVLT